MEHRDVARTPGGSATVDPQGSGRSGKIEGRPRCRQDSGGGPRRYTRKAAAGRGRSRDGRDVARTPGGERDGRPARQRTGGPGS